MSNAAESCGTCSLCCKILYIDADTLDDGSLFKEKDWQTWCEHCIPGSRTPCSVYNIRPQACKVFQCLWLQSQERTDVPSLSREMKPERSHVVLAGSHLDDEVLFAYVDTAYLGAWRKEPIRSHLIQVAERNLTVVVVEGNRRFIMTKGRPTFELSEGQVQELANQRYIRMNEDGQVQIAFKQGPSND